jgi:hypothetical protein
LGIGYAIGCLLSILLWKIDRELFFNKMINIFHKIIRNCIIEQIVYGLIILILYFLLKNIKSNEYFNAITAFLIINISNTERKNLKISGVIYFSDSISNISRSLISGFIAPLLYITLLGNWAAFIFAIIYYLSLGSSYKLFEVCYIFLSIIPCLIVDLILYIIYIIKNREFYISFSGSFLRNLFINPYLNADILAAHLESVNFYYHYKKTHSEYLKCYGKYSHSIDNKCIKNYLNITYFLCIFTYIIFFIIDLRVR